MTELLQPQTRASLRREAQAASAPAAPAEAAGPVSRGDERDLLVALQWVVQTGGSDLHITAESAPTMRLDGQLVQLEEFGVWSAERVSAAIEALMSPEQRETFERHLELDFAYALSDQARFRVNVYQQRSARGAAFRLIPTRIRTIEELDLPASISRFATLPRGLVLVTGPTGSGKSTTLAALIDLVNRTRAEHIVTVEDPIEFMHQHKRAIVNQREVGHDTHSFAAALKHVLRQDPDVILVGEMRDLETISVALTAAETGHLVFATLHTQSAAQTIDRIIDVYPPHQQSQVRAQLAATLQGVVCQTLVPKAGGRGRVAASEIMVATSAISNLIREGQTHQIGSALQSGASHGMRTMDQHLAELVNRDIITKDAAMEKAQDVDEMLGMVVAAGPSAGIASGLDFGDAFSRGARS
ncbi:type IV pilus twitching motility protein PilT [Agrococcus sp. SL85]|uniref:type IV pilus twitching motility protein PilT n=1 Tax=Agrococcus sp. SL85 TaxID=2995141 RepID=UPI002D1E3A59|nr:type IV pilus twitching motility protein PilT [Agrococcus sp. SL85]